MDELFVLASHCKQVFYMNDTIDKDCLVIVETNAPDLFIMPDIEEE